MDDYVEEELDMKTPFSMINAWVVIEAYFEEFGLVRQQLDSFNEFLQNTVLDIIGDQAVIDVLPGAQYAPGKTASAERYEVKLGQVRYTKPVQSERGAAKTSPLYPHEARLRNLVYQSDLYVDVHKQAFTVGACERHAPDPAQRSHRNPCSCVQKGGEVVLKNELFGKLPIMVQSDFCRLKPLSDREKVNFGECVFDMGGYFVINGSEKVVVAQERQAYNRVYTFCRKPPSKLAWTAEIRSQMEHPNRPLSGMSVVQFRKGDSKYANAAGGQIRAVIPYVKTEVPVVLVFRAMGFHNDRQCVTHVVYDMGDSEMVEAFRPSLVEAAPITTTDAARDYIAARCILTDRSREDRIKYAGELLAKDLLPHVGVEGDFSTRTRKAYFLGYVVHRLLMSACGRAEEDDRDHFANKRLDLVGPLLGGLFRVLFYKLHKTMRSLLQRSLDETGREPSVAKAIKHEFITRGIRSALATGTWTAGGGGTRSRRACPRCSTASPTPPPSPTSAAPTRPWAGRASRPSPASCTTRSGASFAPRRRPRAPPLGW